MTADPQLLTWRERVHDWILGCRSHSWGWPQKFRGMKYPAPFDSHQACVRCGSTRYFDNKTFVAGPIFRKR